MTCDEARRRLDEDDLPADVAARLAEHCRTCPECRRALDAERAIRRAVAELPVPEPPDEYWTGYASRLGERLAPEGAAQPAGRRPMHGHRVALVVGLAASLVAAVGLAVVLQRGAADGGGHAAATNEVAPAGAASIEAEMARLDAEVRAAESRVAIALAEERRQGLRRRLQRLALSPTPGEVVDRELNRTAFLAVYDADRLSADRRRRAEAIRAYQQVVTLFPRTRWARVARERLTQLELPKGGMNHENPHDDGSVSGGVRGSTLDAGALG